MKFITFILVFLFPCLLFGQDLKLEKVNKHDSTAIVTTWKDLLQSVKLHDNKSFKNHSLDKVVCNRCDYWDDKDLFADISTAAKLPIDSFINEAFTTFEKDGFWKSLESHPSSLSIFKDSKETFYRLDFHFKPENMPEGYIHFINFIKVGNRFKFYGIETIP